MERLNKGRALMAAIESGKPEPTNDKQAAELASGSTWPADGGDRARRVEGAKHTPGHDKYGHFVIFESRSGTFRAAMPDATTAAACAAAPDLLEVCREAERVIRWAAQESAGKVDRETVGGWIHHADKISAAIARAEGAL